MLARENRITSPVDFQRAFKGVAGSRSVRVNAGSCTIRVFNRHDDSDTRFGFIVTKKAGNAVTRNTVKRRLRAAADEVLVLYPKGLEIVVTPTDTTTTVPFSALVVDMIAATRRAVRFLH